MSQWCEEAAQRVVTSLQNLLPPDENANIDWASLRAVLLEYAHLSHKDWARTEVAQISPVYPISRGSNAPVALRKLPQDWNKSWADQRCQRSFDPISVLTDGC